MKKYRIMSAAFAAMLCLASCGGDKSVENQGTKFAPRERTSSMTDSERKAAIEAKKASLNVDIRSMANSNGVKLSVLPPTPSGVITEDISAQIGAKMLGIIAANGIGGVNNVPGFALAATMSETGRQTTGTAPQKSVIKYDIAYQVMNIADGNVYGSVSESVTGVGNSFEEAARNAVSEIKATDALQSMLSTASDRVIAWYNDNLPTLKGQVAEAVNAGNYALALAYVNSVPSQAKAAFDYAAAEKPGLLRKFKAHNAASELTALKALVAKGNDESQLDTDVYVRLALIPEDTPEYAQASKLVEAYEKNIMDRKAAAESRKIAAEESREMREQQMRLAELEASKTIAVAEAKASEQAMRQHMRDTDDSKRGFWGNLGARIISGIDYVTDRATED